jgi:2-hydroxy-3-keto-5-methylthiopentenyl-1-phosphate phosphatase
MDSRFNRTAQIPESVSYSSTGSHMVPSFRVFVDFDGTLVVPNVAILLVEKFGTDGESVAHEVDLQLHSGQITLRQAWERQVALLPADRVDEMTQWAVDTIPLRAGAREFLALLKRENAPTAVVSGGLDFYIRAILEREHLDVPFVSDTLDFSSPGHLRVAHPFGHATCRLCGICKAQVVRSPVHPADRTVFLGDGSTDRYGAEVADIVFARHRLKTYCEGAKIPFIAFDDFDSVRRQFERWFAGSETVPPRRPVGRADSPCPISAQLGSPATVGPDSPRGNGDRVFTKADPLDIPMSERSGGLTQG